MKEDRFTAAAMAATEATRGTVLAATAATEATEDIRGTVLAAMAATRSIIIIIIIGTANISDHSGKALLEQQECSSHVLAAVLRLEQNHQVHRTFL